MNIARPCSSRARSSTFATRASASCSPAISAAAPATRTSSRRSARPPNVPSRRREPDVDAHVRSADQAQRRPAAAARRGRLRRRHPARQSAPRRLRAQPLCAGAASLRSTRPQPRGRIPASSRSTPATTSAHLDREMPLLIPHPSMTRRAHAAAAGARRRLLCRPDGGDGRRGRPLHRRGRRGAGRCRLRAARRSSSIIEEAVKPGAPLVHDTHPGNVAAHFVQVSGKPGRGHRRRPSMSPRSGCRSSARPRRRWSAAPSRRSFDAGHRRADGLGRDAGADLGVAAASLRSSASTRTRFASSRRMSAAASARRCCSSIPTSCWCRWRRCSSAGRSSTSRTGARTSSARARSGRRSTSIELYAKKTGEVIALARQLPARHRRLHPLRHRGGPGRLDLDRRAVPHPQHLGRVHRGLYADRAGDALSRLRPAAVLLRHRAGDGPARRGARPRPLRGAPPQPHRRRRSSRGRARACSSPTGCASASTAASTRRR